MNEWFYLIREIVGWLVLTAAALPSAYLGLLALGALLPYRRGKKGEPAKKIAVVIPAHNETILIEGTVTKALQQEYPKEAYCIYVIADNCSDDTAEKAERAGARVLVRSDNPGKGQGLNAAFTNLLQEDWDAFLVIDADTEMHPQALARISDALHDGAAATQLFYGVLNPKDTMRTVAMEFALSSFNGLRPRGKAPFRISSGIFGNGFCLSRQVLTEVPYLAHSIVEDLEYHLRLLDAGFRVRFIDDAWVKAQMPITAKQAESQRVRWERGRMQMIKAHAGRLLGKAFRGNLTAFEAFIDVVMPPVSAIAMLLIIAFVIGPMSVRFAALGCLSLLVIHYGLGSLKYGSISGLIRIAFYLPWYIVWKTWIVVSSLVKQRTLGWVRTKRHDENNEVEESS
ncbi:glycosyltransferase family 2 protein [Acanthopleuribacter pedis]|uniref:Glycosyltransferase family 2 protein n=1 Tax=Acanthopleuribacter pedis TaxID=442870 RepID=A0A8J7QBY0_9BACT|nr:glycosyltransferase family 2 protein [Acanthopleuribacter pedis]MBO1321627.1 glycosyltransferase family 2 protein [Acanthopleuribacter pedis]